MIKNLGDTFFLGGVGEDIFGESYRAQIARQDPVNKHLLMKFLREYIHWHETNGKFYDGYQHDKRKLHFLSAMRWAWAGAGVSFAAIIINPNFTSKFQSFYLRKFSCLLFGLIGYHWGRKKMDYHMLNMMLKMHDYLPLEVKRAL